MRKERRLFLRLILCLSSLTLLAATGLAQEVKIPSAIEEKTEESAAGDIQWVWGEVVSLDATNNQLMIKYLDYETDTEKEITLKSDANTAYEGVKSVAEIKLQDTVSVDYVIKDGINLAKQINVEKPESLAPDTMPSEIITPEENATLAE